MNDMPAGDGSMILVLLDSRGEPQIVLGGGETEPAPTPAPSMSSAHDKPEAGAG